MESTWLGRKSTTQVLCEKVKQLESDLATAEQDSRQKQARIARLEAAVKELREKTERCLTLLNAVWHDKDFVKSQLSQALKNTEDA